MSPHFGKVSEKSNGRMKSYKAKSAILINLGFFTPFGPLGTHREFCDKKILQCTTRYEIQLGAKFQKKVMDGYPTIVRTDRRTGARH